MAGPIDLVDARNVGPGESPNVGGLSKQEQKVLQRLIPNARARKLMLEDAAGRTYVTYDADRFRGKILYFPALDADYWVVRVRKGWGDNSGTLPVVDYGGFKVASQGEGQELEIGENESGYEIAVFVRLADTGFASGYAEILYSTDQ